jgi:O-antigen ligase
MRSLTRRLLWLFVFTVPWDIVFFPGVGALSRIMGAATFGAAMITIMVEGRFRKPNIIFGFSAAFIGFSALSLLWTISYPDTMALVMTAVQMLPIVWIMQEFAETREQQQSLLAAFCLGELVPLAGVLTAFGTGRALGPLGDRYTTQGFNLDDLGVTLVIGIPIAWHVMMSYVASLRRCIRAISTVYFALAPVGVLLTGTRGAVVAGVVGLGIVPLTLPRKSLRSFLLITGLLVMAAGAAAIVVPGRTWNRVFTIRSEILEGGPMSGRAAIWQAGLDAFPLRPLLGSGVGAFAAAIQALGNKRNAPHNMPLGVLVEQGIVGFSIYLALLGACALTIVRMPPPERKLWAVLMLSWLIGVMSLNWEYRKITWFLFGMMAAQRGLDRMSSRLAHSHRHVTGMPLLSRPVHMVHSSTLDQPAVR